MDSIPILFYDGQTSVERNALLSLKPNNWLIDYSDYNHVADEIIWELDKIAKVEVVNSNYTFRYGDFPQQVIILVDPDRISTIKKYYPEARFLSESSIKIEGWKKILTAVFIFIAFLITVYFFILPPVAEFLAAQIPKTAEINLGNTMLSSFMSGNQENKKLSILANQFANKINFGTSYPIKLIVVKSDEVNAFALPGGNIIIYDGILNEIHSPDAFAALISHEVAHVQYKHSIKSISRSLSGYLFISLILNDINGVTAALADNANSLKNLSYSRELETDADYRATQTLYKNGISQQGMVSLLEMLNSKSDYDHIKFLSTHPLTKDRIRIAKEIAQKRKEVSSREDLKIIWNKLKRSVKAS